MDFKFYSNDGKKILEKNFLLRGYKNFSFLLKKSNFSKIKFHHEENVHP